MANRKYYPVTTQEMEMFVSNLEYWCSQHPANCYKSCDNISQCTASPICRTLRINFSENTYIKLSDSLSKKPSAKSIRDYYRNWKKFNKKVKGTDVVQVLFTYLQRYRENPYTDDKNLIDYINKLKEIYCSFRLKEGCDLATKALKQYPYHLDIIRWWSLFHNRRMRWNVVRETLFSKITDSIADDVKAECYLGIFEASLNEYTRNRHQVNAFKELYEAKFTYLDSVPNKETNGKYYYFLTRFLEEEWWKLPNVAKLSSTIIFHAIVNINKSIELYKNDNSGYTSIDIKPWWLYCHKTMLLKIWEHEEYTAALKQFGELILQEIELNANRKSTQMYAITYYILQDNLKKLNSFLEQLDKTIAQAGGMNNILIEENKISTVDNLTYHYIELLFYNDFEKQTSYQKVITTWFQKNTH